jgi:hypothetical protein
MARYVSKIQVRLAAAVQKLVLLILIDGAAANSGRISGLIRLCS